MFRPSGWADFLIFFQKRGRSEAVLGFGLGGGIIATLNYFVRRCEGYLITAMTF